MFLFILYTYILACCCHLVSSKIDPIRQYNYSKCAKHVVMIPFYFIALMYETYILIKRLIPKYARYITSVCIDLTNRTINIAYSLLQPIITLLRVSYSFINKIYGYLSVNLLEMTTYFINHIYSVKNKLHELIEVILLRYDHNKFLEMVQETIKRLNNACAELCEKLYGIRNHIIMWLSTQLSMICSYLYNGIVGVLSKYCLPISRYFFNISYKIWEYCISSLKEARLFIKGIFKWGLNKLKMGVHYLIGPTINRLKSLWVSVRDHIKDIRQMLKDRWSQLKKGIFQVIKERLMLFKYMMKHNWDEIKDNLSQFRILIKSNWTEMKMTARNLLKRGAKSS